MATLGQPDRTQAKWYVDVYFVAVVVTAIATVTRLLLDPLLGDNFPFVTFFAAIAAAAWYGGFRPALLALILGVCVAWYVFIPPRYSIYGTPGPNVVGLVIFAIMGFIVAIFGEAMGAARRSAEEQQERLRTTLASIGDAVITTDIAGRVTSMNAVAEALTGWTTLAAIGQPLDDVFRIVNEETRKPVDNPATRALREGVVVGLANHTILIAKGGKEWPIDDSAAPIRCRDGEVVGCVLVFRDISERYHKERATREAQQQLATTLESVTDGFVRYDRDWRIVYVNSEAERISNLTREEMLGKTPWELFPEMVGTKVETEYRRAVAEQTTVEFENYYAPFDRWYAVKGYPAPDGGLVTFVRDITDAKQQQAALEASEGRFRHLADAMPQIVYTTRPDGGVEFINGRWAEYTGQVAAGTDGLPEVVHPDDLPNLLERWQAALAAGTTLEAEFRLRRASDGIYRWFLTRSVPIRDAAGQVTYWYGTSTDIDDLRRAEQGWEAAATTLNSLVASAPVGIVLFDTQMRYRHINEPLAEMNGIPAEAHIGRTVAEIVPDMFEQIAPLFERVLRTGETIPDIIHEGETLKAPGEKRAWQVSWFPIHGSDGRPTGVGAIVQEITSQRRVEQEREAALRTLYTLIEQCPFGIYIVDDQFRIAQVNAGSQDKAFANIRPLIGRPFDEVMRILWPEPVATECITAFRQTLVTGEPYASRDFISPRADTDELEGYEWELHRIPLAGGRYGVVCYYFDATRLRQAEQALKEADRKKDEFLATLAHELRNPLAPIQNGLQVMKRADGDPATVEQSRAILERQVEQLARLIDDLMDLSRISRGKIVLKKQRLQLADVLRDAVDTSRPLIDRQGHGLDFVVPNESLVVDGDHTRLTQVFANLLNNAAKYTDPGGRIRLALEREGEAAVVTVVDTGVGIAADMLPRVFDMFAQVDRSLEKAQGGLGIGLNIVKKLVEMHGGTVVGTSAGLGLGSTFTVRLPIVVGTANARIDQPATAPVTLSRRRVLVVDDNPDGAQSLAMMLQMIGHETLAVHDGLAAVAAAEDFRPDIILMDIGMPKLNGYEACRRIRAATWGQAATIVACTGWGQEADRLRAKEAGFDIHLTKPVDPTTLERLLTDPAAMVRL